MSIVERRQFIYKPELSEYYKKWQPDQESLSENLAEFRDFLVNERALLSGDVAKKLGRAITQSDIESFFKSLKDERGPAVTDRNLDKISEMYGLSPENFIQCLGDSKVLDVGVGFFSLAKDLKQKGSDCQITSIDLRQQPLDENTGSTHKVQTDFSYLPFKSESFDIVLATESLTRWAHSTKEISRGIAELYRICNKGGMIFISPVVKIQTRMPLSPDGQLMSLPRFSQTKKGFAMYVPEDDKNKQFALHTLGIKMIDIFTKFKLRKPDSVTFISGTNSQEQENFEKILPSAAIIKKD